MYARWGEGGGTPLPSRVTRTCPHSPEKHKTITPILQAASVALPTECGGLSCQVTQLHSAMIRWMITVLLRLTPDMEDKELEEINKQTDDQEVDASLGGGEILLQAIPEEICNTAQRLFAQLREFSVVLTKCCSDLVIDLMQVGNMSETVMGVCFLDS